MLLHSTVQEALPNAPEERRDAATNSCSNDLEQHEHTAESEHAAAAAATAIATVTQGGGGGGVSTDAIADTAAGRHSRYSITPFHSKPVAVAFHCAYSWRLLCCWLIEPA
jgi:hypothetical protein